MVYVVDTAPAATLLHSLPAAYRFCTRRAYGTALQHFKRATLRGLRAAKLQSTATGLVLRVLLPAPLQNTNLFRLQTFSCRRTDKTPRLLPLRAPALRTARQEALRGFCRARVAGYRFPPTFALRAYLRRLREAGRSARHFRGAPREIAPGRHGLKL